MLNRSAIAEVFLTIVVCKPGSQRTSQRAACGLRAAGWLDLAYTVDTHAIRNLEMLHVCPPYVCWPYSISCNSSNQILIVALYHPRLLTEANN